MARSPAANHVNGKARFEERDGVAWINNPAADPGPEGAEPPFALVLEQTFGAEEEPADSLLSFIIGMAIDEAGNVRS